MHKIKKLNFLLGVVILTTITSCSNEPNLPVPESQSKQDEWIKQGKKLENPYSIKNMRIALRNLKANRTSLTSKAVPIDVAFDVKPNYIYVEFKPKTEADEAILKQDSSVVLFDYPLDYEFTDDVLDARPALRSNQVPNYYSAIKIDSETASDAQYETLEELYIPEEDPYFGSKLPANQKISTQKEILLDELLDEAFKLTGNERQDSQAKTSTTAKWIFGKKWWPSGNITVYDEVAGANKPVVGAQVLIRQWFTVRQAITDQNGNFSTSSIRGSARYVLQWERYNYSIRNGSFFQAETKSHTEQRNVPWNLNITGGDDKYHALIHQAAHDYYYGHRFGLTSPPRNGFDIGTIQMKIAAREISNSSTGSSYSHSRSDFTLGLSAQVHIKAWGANSDRIYGTTIHELTHAAHSMVDRNSYDNLVRDAWTFPIQGGAVDNNKRTLETWARTVEIAMTLQRYKSQFGITNYSCYFDNNRINYQNQTILEENHYTSAGYDMTDEFNQRIAFTIAYPNDRVSGYTLKQLQDALVGARSWSQWRDNIKNKYDNPTEQYLDELFNNWPN